MQKNATKITHRPNANGHFIKLCNAYGIRLDGNFLTKKHSIYGRDEKGLFYCDMFPNYQGKKTPTLKVWRIVAQPFNWGTLHQDAKWVCSEETGSTVARIWHLYNKMGRLQPLAYADLDCKKNNKITHKLTYGKRNSQKVWTGGVTEICSWKKENSTMFEVGKNPYKHLYVVKVVKTQSLVLTGSDELYKIGDTTTCDGDTCFVVEIKR